MGLHNGIVTAIIMQNERTMLDLRPNVCFYYLLLSPEIIMRVNGWMRRGTGLDVLHANFSVSNQSKKSQLNLKYGFKMNLILKKKRQAYLISEVILLSIYLCQNLTQEIK